ncbi:MAG: SURF1 family protein [Gemmobacter sp.]|nr:SURF1 family protein [Gemmobacter sp.]
MSARLIFPLFLGLVGAAILIGLGTWQLQRLSWKQDILAAIDSRIVADPVPLPAEPDQTRDQYLPVTVRGRLTGEDLDVLVSRKQQGAGYRVIAVLETEGRRVMVDRGFLPEALRAAPRPTGDITVGGNLLWPQEVDSYTPAPDAARKIWFARDVPVMAAALDAQPVLIVSRTSDPADPAVQPMAVDGANIPNDHLQYAITWFLLAVVWLGMTGLMVWRIWRPTPDQGDA